MVGRSAYVVRYETPECDVVFYLVSTEPDPLTWKAEPDQGCAESGNGADGVEVVDGDAELFDGVVFWLLFCELHDTPSHSGMKKTHSHGGLVSCSTRLDGFDGLRHLEDMLGGLVEAAFGYFGREAACSCEHFCDSGSSHPTEKGLIR